MNPLAVWIIFGIGILFLLVGGALMIWGAVQKRSAAGADDKTAPDIWSNISKIVDSLAQYIGPNRAARIGLLLVIIGLILIFLPAWLPVRAT